MLHSNINDTGRLAFSQMKIEYIEVGALKSWPNNARTHSKKQINQIANAIRRFGFTNPIVVDSENTILAGHGRHAAAERLGHTEIPCIRIERMTKDEKRAYILADNKLALNAGWDEDLLALELKELAAIDLELNVLTGFSIAETDDLIDGLTVEETGNPADDFLPRNAPVRCMRGDIWQLGPHRLICGDARDSAGVAALMNGERAQMVFTDPPYNVVINGNVGGRGSVKHPEFLMASGEMNPAEFTSFLSRSFQNLVANSQDGSIHFIFMDWRHIAEILEAGKRSYTELKNMNVWVKDNGGMGTFYRSRHELIFVFKSGTAPHQNNFELGQHGRYRTNVWQYRGSNTMKTDRLQELALHPTVKPVQMIADALKDVSSRGGIVLDLFGGSGSTLIAAHKTGRRGYLCEYDPIYCDRILHRWEIFANDEAERVACGLPALNAD